MSLKLNDLDGELSFDLRQNVLHQASLASLSSTLHSQQEMKSRQQPKPKPKTKQPMKVVYISNPIKFNITASEFRALVQQLTGQHSELPAYDHVGGDNQTVREHHHGMDLSGKPQKPVEILQDHEDDDDDDGLMDSSFSSLDDYFLPQIFENLSSANGLLHSSFLSESTAATATAAGEVNLLRK
ncbi:uncharacterized protein LOC126677658 [Mercurialis annua]|uniref:uncharacterized protein LOC126677658 n=1 Tax=Mercurialis annua TaxID=3986 RepID=UPI0021601BBF|nr:uncharacterized protein LOC126677658 [Mercurialis annua]